MSHFFDMEMDMDSIVACVPTCTAVGNPPRFAPVRYGDCLMERLYRNDAYCKPADLRNETRKIRCPMPR